MSANPPARLEDEFCISCERMLLLPIWGGVFEGDSFAVSINGRSLLIFVVAHGALCKWVCEVWRGGFSLRVPRTRDCLPGQEREPLP